MLKIVVFDCGFGGELFADRLSEELPVVEVIRVIDWRHAHEIQSSPRAARKFAREALRPYLGKVDLIIFANHLLTITSLKFFQRKYQTQKFLGLTLKRPDSFVARNVLILTTKAVTHTISYHNFLFHINRKNKTLALDTWASQIDEGDLTSTEIKNTLKHFTIKTHFTPGEIILACSHFSDLKPALKLCFGCTIKIYDSTDETIRQVYKILNIRGGAYKKSKRSKAARKSLKH